MFIPGSHFVGAENLVPVLVFSCYGLFVEGPRSAEEQWHLEELEQSARIEQTEESLSNGSRCSLPYDYDENFRIVFLVSNNSSELGLQAMFTRT